MQETSILRCFHKWVFIAPYCGLPWLIWFYAVFSCFCYTQGGVFDGQLTGYDDHVRMVQVLNWVNGAGWYDRTIMRVNAPDGFPTIWSRLVDTPYAVVILIGQQIADQRTAALMAAFTIPLLELAIFFSVARYFVRPLVGKKNARLVVLFLMFTSVMNYKSFSMSGFQTGEVSHHSWYVILNLLLLGAAARIAIGVSGLGPARMMGFTAAILLAVGIEAFPLIAAAMMVLAALAWLSNRLSIAQQTSRASIYTTLVGLLLIPMHQSPSRWFDISFAEPSLLGPILMSVAALFFVAQSYILRRLGDHKIYSLIVTAVVATVLGSVLFVIFPEMLAGPAVALSPAERALAFKEHAEAWPLYRAAFDRIDFIGLAMPTVIALAGAVYAARTTRSPRRRVLYLAYGGFTFLFGSMALCITRLYHHAMTVACAWLLWVWRKIMHSLPRNQLYALTAFGAFIMLGPFWMLLLPALDQDLPFVSQVLLYPAKIQTFPDPCNSVAFGEFLNRHYTKDTLLIVPGADSSRMLFYSDLKIDFLNNYPSQNKFIDNETFFGTQNMSMAKDIILRHNIDLVAICKILQNVPPLKPGEEPMFYERLEYGQVPNWLKPVDTRMYGYLLYEVDKSLLLK